jgi:hypothetical protein
MIYYGVIMFLTEIGISIDVIETNQLNSTDHSWKNEANPA